jgi:hypothetical protein
MNYTKTTPCSDCPFLVGTEHAFTNQRLRDFASGPFPCHKTADVQDGSFTATKKSVHCAGALIYQEKRNTPSQMTRIAERLGMYDRTHLNMESPIR